MNWQEWEEVLGEVGNIWPVASQGDGYLTTDYAGEYAKMDTLRAWYQLVSGFTLTQVLSAVFRYAETDSDSQWPPQGPTIARLARDVAAEDAAREARERPALPAPDPDRIDGRSWAQRQGYDTIWDAVKGRCAERSHHGMATDASCRLCNGLSPMSKAMAEAANG